MASESTMNPEEQDENATSLGEGSSDLPAAGLDPSEGIASEEGASTQELRPGATDVQAYIGRQLRAVYDDVVKQPIPDRFLALMKQLEEGSREP